jgi:hypothetical protein
LRELLLLLIKLLAALDELARYNVLDCRVQFGKQTFDLALSQFVACNHLQSDLKLTLYLTNRLFSVSLDCKHLREHFVFLPKLLAFLS